MKRHPFDAVSFLFGAAFTTFAIVVVATDPLDLLGATWVWPAVLIVLGVGLLLAPLTRRSPAPVGSVPQPTPDPQAASDAEPSPDPEPTSGP